MKSKIAWVAAIVPLWIVLILCTHWEPVERDGWGHYLYQKNYGLSWHTLYEFAKGTYTHNNPRLGQVLTLLTFTPGPWHAIFTPLAELLLFYGLTALALGRWPSFRRTDDALLFATIFALTAICAPEFGLMLFYRPYTGNYLFGFVINVLFLLPYRFAYETPTKWGVWWIPIMLVGGFASGLCNEHTGPAIVAAAATATFMCWRRDRKIAIWMIVGIVAMIAGGIALFKAPGQSIRYNALASQDSMFGRIISRGIAKDAGILFVMFGWAVPAIPWIAVAVAARKRDEKWITRTELAIFATSVLIAATLLLSPKIGARLYLGSVSLLCTAIGAFVVRHVREKWGAIVVAIGAAGVIAFVGWKCISGYSQLGPAFAARVELLNHAPPNSVLDLPSYKNKRTRWILDDDLKIKTIRDIVAGGFGLALIKLDGVGTSDAVQDDLQ
ncbi:MAG: DUF6056 family protein [Kofleriaceae bacterium]